MNITRLLAAAALLASCGEPSPRAEIGALESAIVLPPGAGALMSYSRFYAIHGDIIEAQYVSREMVRHEVEDRIGRQELAPNIYLVASDDMPIIMDGGCSVLTLS